MLRSRPAFKTVRSLARRWAGRDNLRRPKRHRPQSRHGGCGYASSALGIWCATCASSCAPLRAHPSMKRPHVGREAAATSGCPRTRPRSKQHTTPKEAPQRASAAWRTFCDEPHVDPVARNRCDPLARCFGTGLPDEPPSTRSACTRSDGARRTRKQALLRAPPQGCHGSLAGSTVGCAGVLAGEPSTVARPRLFRSRPRVNSLSRRSPAPRRSVRAAHARTNPPPAVHQSTRTRTPTTRGGLK